MSTEQVCTPKLSDFWGGIRMANGIYINRINCIFLFAHIYTDEWARRLMSDSFSFVNTIPASLCALAEHKFKEKNDKCLYDSLVRVQHIQSLSRRV
jgi:hypothetical protein